MWSGAAGAVESVFSVMSVETGVIPATVNCDNIDTNIEALNINIVRSVHKEVNSFHY